MGAHVQQYKVRTKEVRLHKAGSKVQKCIFLSKIYSLMYFEVYYYQAGSCVVLLCLKQVYIDGGVSWRHKHNQKLMSAA